MAFRRFGLLAFATFALVLLSSVHAGKHPRLGTTTYSKHRRKVYAWAVAKHAQEAAAQLQNESWAGVFDGVQALCGTEFEVVSEHEIRMTVNHTLMDMCKPIIKAVKATGGELQAWTFAIPQQALFDKASRDSMISSSIAVLTSFGFDGLSFDDESECVPRSTLKNFTAWVAVINEFSDRFHARGLTVSAAVQAMFGIQDVPWAPQQACDKAPWEYPLDNRVTDQMTTSSIDRWLEMDTYYFTTARFLNALDYYTTKIPPSKVGVSMMLRTDLSPDDMAARFHAISRSGADWINMFLLPLDDEWRPWLRKWKTHCRHCPNGLLGCYEPTVHCDPKPPGLDAAHVPVGVWEVGVDASARPWQPVGGNLNNASTGWLRVPNVV